MPALNAASEKAPRLKKGTTKTEIAEISGKIKVVLYIIL